MRTTSMWDYQNWHCLPQKTSKAALESQAPGTRLFTTAVPTQRGCPKDSPWPREVQVRLSEGHWRHPPYSLPYPPSSPLILFSVLFDTYNSTITYFTFLLSIIFSVIYNQHLLL